jgi:starch synthase
MKVLYVASDQTIPGETGGSVHVHEVSRELAKRGHAMDTVVLDQGKARVEEPGEGGYRIHRIAWWPPHRFFRFRAKSRVTSLIDRLKPDVVMERYYNFGGEGVRAAELARIPSLLEVNSPIVDHRGSWKARLDAAMVFRPMRRYRESLVRSASALISPLREIVPQFAHAKTHVVTWGANVDAFQPGKRSEARRASWGASPSTCVVLFSGSHRPWHGVHTLLTAAREMRNRKDVLFVLAGGDHEGTATDFNGRFLGRVPYAEMPEVTASADVSVAPYDRSRLPSLELGFFWSPLKIFEALSSGIATATLDIPPLNQIVRSGEEGVFFRENDATDLARVLGDLATDRDRRLLMGTRARERAPRFSWAAHAEQLEGILEGVRRT